MVSLRKDLSVLISSYDGASDLWKPLHQTFKKHWENCPFDCYLATNKLVPDLPGFQVLSVGAEESWSHNIEMCLNKIDTDYVLVTYDDLFLTSSVDNSQIIDIFNTMIENNWDYVRLHQSPQPDEPFSAVVGRISEGSVYRTSTVWSIFRKSTLLHCLRRTESAWEFERSASERSNQFRHFYCTYKPVIPFLNGVVKGLWIPSVIKTLEGDGIDIDRNARGSMTKTQVFMERLKRRRMWIFMNIVPSRFRWVFHKSFRNA